MIAGITSYGFLVISARALGPEEYAPLSVLWAMVFLAGPGFFLPLEQEVSRALASRRARGEGAGPLLRRAAILGGALAVVLIIGTLLLREPLLEHLFDDDVLLLVAFLLGLCGYCAGHLARGGFSGSGRFRPYAVYIGGEGGVRMLVCVVLAVVGASTAGPYGLAVGIAPIVAVAVSLRGQHDLLPPGPDAPWDELSSALGWLLLGSVLAQGLVNAGPLAVKVLATDEQADEAGRFLAGLVIARVPLFLFQAVQAALLPRLSALASAGRFDDFRVGLRRLLIVVGAVAAVGTATAFAIGPFVVRTMFGAEFDLGRRSLGLLAAASGAYMIAIALAQGLIALSAHARMAMAWALGVLVFVIVTAAGEDLFLRVELGLLAGCGIAALAQGTLMIESLRAGASVVEPGDFIEAIHDVPLEP
jgi:O-antigen/teichoic acid export membrane protein